LPRARIAAPVLHALVFGIASILLLFSNEHILEGPTSLPFVVLWLADIPISLIASERLWFHAEHARLVWALWGVIGTIWWYFLGISIEAWIRRFS
jgi:hypothetical protein